MMQVTCEDLGALVFCAAHAFTMTKQQVIRCSTALSAQEDAELAALLARVAAAAKEYQAAKAAKAGCVRCQPRQSMAPSVSAHRVPTCSTCVRNFEFLRLPSAALQDQLGVQVVAGCHSSRLICFHLCGCIHHHLGALLCIRLLHHVDVLAMGASLRWNGQHRSVRTSAPKPFATCMTGWPKTPWRS